jgi:thiamine biosynthesis protein ThiI
MDHVVVRPGELALKQDNRSFFERILVQNLTRALGVEPGAIDRRRGRFYIGPVADAAGVARRAARVFGVANTSPATRVAGGLEAIVQETVAEVRRALAGRGPEPVRFRVTHAADKTFPTDAMELQRVLGRAGRRRAPGRRPRHADPTSASRCGRRAPCSCREVRASAACRSVRAACWRCCRAASTRRSPPG